ncbi:conserved hypothetical protein [Ricinus communis]|uniref:Uncharacterized protein n=1 Tax=Ricinus communis TaxID=3988 RepID=B9RSM9_RICCO|nr:conserved hypothetical protein [Ricinus communis]
MGSPESGSLPSHKGSDARAPILPLLALLGCPPDVRATSIVVSSSLGPLKVG